MNSQTINLSNSTIFKQILNSTDKLIFRYGNALVNVLQIGSTAIELNKATTVGASLTVSGQTNFNNNVNFNNNNISNVNFNSGIKSSGDNTYTGTFNFVRKIENNSQGGITWYSGRVTVKNGLITKVENI